MVPKVSIIIPVYNVDKCLEKCILSVLNQTLKSIEIIAINDGSTDRSKEILEYFSNIDSRLKVINQSNQGVSTARNYGLSIARGEYIGFVDSDDYIAPEMYEKLYNCVKEYDCDIGVANVFDEKETGKEISLTFETGVTEINKENIDQFLENNISKLGAAVWHKIFRKTLIIQNNIYFHSYKEVSSEDIVFNLFALACSDSIYYLNEPLYNYIHHPISLTKSDQFKKNRIERSKKTIELIHEFYYKKGLKIPRFLCYLTYSEMIAGLQIESNKIRNLYNAIKQYKEIDIFRQNISDINFGKGIHYYLRYKQDKHSLLYYWCESIFMRSFTLLLLFNLDYLASLLYYFGIKTKNKRCY